MGDLFFVAIVIAFFAVCVVFVKACDSIIGPDPDPVVLDKDETEPTNDALLKGTLR